jgi:preprotein translocase subunit SecD
MLDPRHRTVRTRPIEKVTHAMPHTSSTRNVSTILTAAVLLPYGTRAVKGFAVTLIAGYRRLVSSRRSSCATFYLIWSQRSRGAQTLSI